MGIFSFWGISVVVYSQTCVRLGSVSSPLSAHTSFVHSALLLLQDLPPPPSFKLSEHFWDSSAFLETKSLEFQLSFSLRQHKLCLCCVLNSRHRQFADLVGTLATGCWKLTSICTKAQLELLYLCHHPTLESQRQLLLISLHVTFSCVFYSKIT